MTRGEAERKLAQIQRKRVKADTLGREALDDLAASFEAMKAAGLTVREVAARAGFANTKPVYDAVERRAGR